MTYAHHEAYEQAELDTLIQWALSGDQQAHAAIYRRLVGPTYRLALGVLLHEQDAEEVVQDSFAYAFQNLHHFDPEKSAFKTWLYTITMSRCRNKRRRKWLPTIQLSVIIEWLPGAAPHPEDVVSHQHTRQAVFDALKQLSPKLREAIVLRYFEGLTYREMGEVLNCPTKTAASRVRLAHEALYDLLAGDRDLLLGALFSYD